MSKTHRNTKLDRLFALQIEYKIQAPYPCFESFQEYLLGEIR